MSVWTAFWALAGGGLVGLIATGLMLDGLRAGLRLEGVEDRGVWNPFPPLDGWMRAADLVTLVGAVVVCGLCIQRISRSDATELRLWPGIAALAALFALGLFTRSWWSLAATLPLAAALRYAARPVGPRWSWRRRAAVAGGVAAVYGAVLAPAVLSLQQHPLFASPTASCGVGYGGQDRVTGICLIVENVAFTRSATVLGVDAGGLPGSLPWTLSAPARTIGAGEQREIDVRVRHAACLPGTQVGLRSVPLRVRVGGRVETAAIPIGGTLIARC